jgi:beta-glucanase (GH16 family)
MRNICFALAVAIMCGSALADPAPSAPSFASNYQMVWDQNFSAMTTQSQLNAVAGSSMGTGTWVCHTPWNGDWFPFADPTGTTNPFSVGNGYLDIRVQQNASTSNGFDGYTGGLLCSMDKYANGFAQKYGYFEASMKTPGGANTWPAFWLCSNAIANGNSAELDVTESYGNWGAGKNNSPAGNPNYTEATWHQWLGAGGQNSNGASELVSNPGLTAGYHTYGVDVEPTGISWYVDRQKFWTSPIFDAANQPLYVLLNLALGGGNYNNSNGTGYNWALTPSPSDLDIKYVAVWASPNSPNYIASPEPASVALLGLALLPALGLRRRSARGN